MSQNTRKIDEAIDMLKKEIKKDDVEIGKESISFKNLSNVEDNNSDDDIELLSYEKDENDSVNKKQEINQVEKDLVHTKEIEKISNIEANDYIYNDVDYSNNLEDNNYGVEEDSNTVNNLNEDENNSNNTDQKKKKMKFRIIIITIVLVDLIVLLIILINVIANNPNFFKTRGQFLREQKKVLNDYGSALENMIGIYYQKNKVILKYGEVDKLVDFDQKIVCEEHDVYSDGKVYLNNCKINGKKTSYSYGEKQGVIKNQSNSKSSSVLDVFLDSQTGIFSLQKNDATTSYETFKITCSKTCTDFEIVANGYISYFDEKGNVHMKEIRTDSAVLPTLSYTSVLPIKTSFDYDYDYAAFKVDNKWGIYNYKSGLAVVPPIYDSMSIDLSTGIEQSIKHISALGNTNNIAVSLDKKLGVINYKSGQNIIESKYSKVVQSGNYLNCVSKDTTSEVYDFNGFKYFSGLFDKIYGIVDNNYVLVEVNKQTRMIQFDGNILYNFGNTNHGALNFFVSYNKGALFQFYKDSKKKDTCINYIYSNGVGSLKESNCDVIKF